MIILYSNIHNSLIHKEMSIILNGCSIGITCNGIYAVMIEDQDWKIMTKILRRFLNYLDKEDSGILEMYINTKQCNTKTRVSSSSIQRNVFFY